MDNDKNVVGLMRRRVTWQTLGQPTSDSVGQAVDAWVTQGIFWARVESLSGRELFNARQLKATTTHRITMRNVGPIAPSGRLLESTGRTFGIDSVRRVDDRNAYLILDASELKNPQ